MNSDTRPRYDIVIPGNYFCDVIFTGIPRFPKLGTELYCGGLDVTTGGVLNSVIGLRRLGVNVGWSGVIGSDFFSQYVMDRIRQEKVDTRMLELRDSAVRRVTVSLSFPSDRAFVTYVDPVPGHIELAQRALKQAEFPHLHFNSLDPRPEFADLLAECGARGIRVTMDCQHQENPIDFGWLKAVISQVEIFMPNENEAKFLTGESTVEAALDVLSRYVPRLVIKCGGDGAIARWEGVDLRVPALPVTPVDTTGAGDTFNAGLLAAYLEGRSGAECLRWGNYCGGMSTQGYGGSTTAPTRAQLDAYLATTS